MQRPNSSLTLSRAHRLLALDHALSRRTNAPSLTKLEIQQAFVRAAQLYHPDSRHNADAHPCATTFQECHEAREMLLAHYTGSQSTRHKSPRYQNHYSQSSSSSERNFAQGFPYRTMRVLTLKQNLALRGAVMMVISVGSLYENWQRREHRRRKIQKNGG